MSSIPLRQVPALHHRRVGDAVVTAVGDGYLDGSLSVLRGIGEAEAAAMLTAAFRPVPRRTSVNCFVIRAQGRVALVDCGCGTGMQASAGKLLANLAAAEVGAESVDTVLLTHMHPDHSNALADEAGGARFPNATLRLHAAEHAYWTSEAAAREVERTGHGVPYFAAAQAQLAPYATRLSTFEGGEVFPGVTALALPGHTPGHTGYWIQSGDQSLLIWGDIVHVPEIQVPRPEVSIQFDVDPVQAVATRRAILARVADERLTVAGMHLHFPGYANIAREGGSFRLASEVWRPEF